MFCEQVTLSGPLGDAINVKDAFFAANFFVQQTGSPLSYHEQGVVIIPSKEYCGDVVRQCTSFTGEHSEFIDSEHEKEQALFENFIMSQRPEQECVLFHTLIDSINPAQYDCLVGKSFKVTVFKETDKTLKNQYKVELLSE